MIVDKRISIVSVETVPRSDPEKTFTVLHHRHHSRLRQSLLNSDPLNGPRLSDSGRNGKENEYYICNAPHERRYNVRVCTARDLVRTGEEFMPRSGNRPCNNHESYVISPTITQPVKMIRSHRFFHNQYVRSFFNEGRTTIQ